MSNQTLKRLAREGRVKKTDLYKVLLDDVQIEEGFNLREDTEDLDAHIESITESILAGSHVPPMLARVDDDGQVVLVDGHSRRRAYLRARDRGAEIEYVSVEQFRGNDADRVATIITSSQGRALLPLEAAKGVKKLRSFGWTNAQIAKHTGKTPSYIDALMVLADAPSAVQQHVADGKIAAATAIEIVREHGEKAPAIIEKELERASAAGKKKVTKGSMAPKGPPKKVLARAYDGVQSFRQRLPESTVSELESMRGLDAEEVEGRKVTVDAAALLELMEAVEEGQAGSS